MDKLEQLKLEALRGLNMEVRKGLIENQNNRKYSDIKAKEMDVVIDIIGRQIDDLTSLLSQRGK